MFDEQLTLRVAPQQTRDLVARTIQVRAETIDEETRSVEAVLATEAPVQVFDFRRLEVIDEVLRIEGAELPGQMPMLETHNRWDLDDVLGSVRQMRREGGQVVGRLFFAENDDKAQRAWNKVRQGHITDVSVGYTPNEYIDIPAGESRNVGGRQYTAKSRTLRVTTRWTPREGSLVPIGADPAAKIREASAPPTAKETSMPPKLRKHLESIGLRADATEAQAWEFFGFLEGDRRAAAEALRQQPPNPPADPPPNPPADPPAPPPAPVNPPAVQRATPPPTPPPTPPADPPAPADPDALRLEGAQRERLRQDRIRELADLAGDAVGQDLVARAISETWDTARAQNEFVAAVRGHRAPAVGSDAPAGHVRSRERDCTLRALGAAMVIRGGLDPIKQAVRNVDGRLLRYGASAAAELERAANDGDRYADMSLVDICREACRLDGIAIPSTREATIRAAVSGSALSNIFTTNVSAQLLAGYTDAADTTVGWVSESDVPNFQTNERVAMGKFGALTKHARGGTAEHMDQSDSKESYRIARYSGQFVVDEMDIIDDRLGALGQVAPQDMGLSAAQLRPNMVYAILLANAALDADSTALFDATTHKNYGTTTTALAAATLQTAIAAMGKQRIKGRPINIRPRFLLVPQDLRFAAEIILTSGERVIASTSGGTFNPLQNIVDLRFDDRLGVAGVTDPVDGKAYAGTVTNYFLAARPGEEGAKTIEVGYLRGSGRAPQVRPFTLTQGQWGVGWDVKMDIGAKALDYRALYMATGA